MTVGIAGVRLAPENRVAASQRCRYRGAWPLHAICLYLLFAATALAASEKPVVYTVNYPLQYFAQRIAGEYADVVFPAPADVDPAFWVPDIDTITRYQQADLILLNGAGYARWTRTVSLPAARLVDTSQAFRDDYIELTATTTHSHGPGGEHAHAGMAFTTWLDFSQAATQALAVRDALHDRLPERSDAIDEAFAQLQQELLVLDTALGELQGRDPHKPLLASHPVYQYLGRRYALHLESLMWEPDRLPTDAQWSALERRLQAHPARWMLWEAEPLGETTRRLQALGIQSLVFSPAANRPAEGDFMSVMRRNIETLSSAWQ